MAELTFSDLLSQESKRNPSGFYGRLREQEPLTHIADIAGMGAGWLITNYDDALAILKDPRFIKDGRKVAPLKDKQSSSPFESIIAWKRDMLSVDPPDHTRLRGLVSKAFTPRMIEQLRPRIQQITDELLDAVQEQRKMDLIADFAYPLPITVISELLGIPATDHQRFRVWTQAIMNSQAGDKHTYITARDAFFNYIKNLLAEKRIHPGHDLTSGLVQAQEQGDRLSEEELFATIWLLIIAGHETTVNLIGNGTLALLQHPEQMHQLQNNPSLIPSAIEELLRYTSPVSVSSFRFAGEDILMHGKLIHKGEMVFLSLVAANNDPTQFSDPDTLDITRQIQQHLAFGKGIHYCLGAPLARLEGQIAFGTLLQRLPNLRLASDPDQLHWNRHFALRGLTSLPVTF